MSQADTEEKIQQFFNLESMEEIKPHVGAIFLQTAINKTIVDCCEHLYIDALEDLFFH
jgi:hypothetical protein